ncbi:MAG: diguanylate cyclase response regulator [Sulfuricella sp.]|nr:diguanylate cyclase response regulator [Sulfuricella sp.]
MKPEEDIRVLLVEDNPGDVRLIQETLRDAGDRHLTLDHADCLKAALEILGRDEHDLILLDLSLPDSHGLETVEKTEAAAPEIPIVILTGMDDVNLGLQAVRAGAQDYLIKGEITGHLLIRAIRYAIERHRMQAALRILSLIDDLTGLYNRRGFLTLAEHQLRLSRRKQSAFYLIFADLDGMKHINDTWGHKEGDQALIQAARLLKDTFRGSDIIARMGGDEFAIIAVEPAASSAEQIAKRFEDNIAAFNAHSGKPYRLSISIGVVECIPDNHCSLEDSLAKADTLMYRNKAERKKAWG